MNDPKVAQEGTGVFDLKFRDCGWFYVLRKWKMVAILWLNRVKKF